MSLKFNHYSISDVNKSFLWFPPKTASTFLTFIFQHFDFYSIVSDEYFYIKKEVSDHLQNSHNMGLFRGHENYKLISSIRNPYSRFISSYFHYLKVNKSDINKMSLIDFLDDTKINKHHDRWFEINNAFNLRVPDYFIRIENLYEDLCEIPFVYESSLRKSGVLKELVVKKMNKGDNRGNWKNHITQGIAETIYERNKRIFELGLYDKDSWKD